MKDLGDDHVVAVVVRGDEAARVCGKYPRRRRPVITLHVHAEQGHKRRQLRYQFNTGGRQTRVVLRGLQSDARTETEIQR